MSESSQTPPPVAASKQDNTKAIIITALITAFVTSLTWIGIGIGVFFFHTAEPPPFTLTYEAPETVVLGEQATLLVQVTNHSEESATLGSIDITGDIMEGFQLVSVDPQPSSQTSIFGIHSFYSKHKLKPAESVTFTFSLSAIEEGYWSGSIDACTPMENFVSDWIEIEVVKELIDEREEIIPE